MAQMFGACAQGGCSNLGSFAGTFQNEVLVPSSTPVLHSGGESFRLPASRKLRRRLCASGFNTVAVKNV